MTRSSARRHNTNARRVAGLLVALRTSSIVHRVLDDGALTEGAAQTLAIRVYAEQSQRGRRRIDQVPPPDVNWALVAEILNRASWEVRQ